jgi:hypothetical protein
MDELEEINQMNRINYYGKSHWDEDAPYEEKEIPLDVQEKFEKLEFVYDDICSTIDNLKETTKKCIEEREKKKINSDDFIYGEIVIIYFIKNFRTFSYIINHIIFKSKIILKNGYFYDLGSV